MHIHNLVFNKFLASSQFLTYARVVDDYRATFRYFGKSTRKLRLLKLEEMEIDVFKQMDKYEKLYNAELKNLASGNVEVMYYLDTITRQKELELDLQNEEEKLERLIFSDSSLKTVEECSTKFNDALTVLKKNVKTWKVLQERVLSEEFEHMG